LPGERAAHALIDGGLSNRLPIDYLFTTPFHPQQILAVDVSNRARHREANLAKIHALRRAHPGTPIAVLQPNTLAAPP